MTTHQFYTWNGLPVRVEWYDATDGELDVSAITAPAKHPDGIIPEGERHALVELLVSKQRGWWASEKAVEEHAEPIGPAVGESAVGLE